MTAVPHDSLVYPLGAKRKLTTEPVCRLCGLEFAQASGSPRQRTRHHLIPQSWFAFAPGAIAGMTHARSNLVPLCRECHHEHVDSRYPVVREMARRKLRGLLTQQEVAFVVAVRGLAWLDIHYPPS